MGHALLQSPVTEEVRSGDIVLRWHAADRYVELRCLNPVTTTEAAARELAPTVERWFEEAEGTILALVDCHNMHGSEAGWRSIFFGLFSRHRRRMRVAWVNMNASIRIIVLMFLTALRTSGSFDGRAFREESEATEWLAEGTAER